MSWHELQALYEKVSKADFYPGKLNERCFSNWESFKTPDDKFEFVIHIAQYIAEEKSERNLQEWKNHYCRFSMISETETIDMELSIKGHRVTGLRWLNRVNMSTDTDYIPQIIFDGRTGIGDKLEAVEIATQAFREIAKYDKRSDVKSLWRPGRVCDRPYYYNLKVEGNLRSNESDRRRYGL